MTQSVVNCEKLSKVFNKVKAVHNLNMQLDEGTLFGLVGPSGCGKTTTLRLVAGFETLDEGTVAIHGRVVSGPGVHVPIEQRRVGMVFQDYALFPHLSVRENVEFGVPKGDTGKIRTKMVLELARLTGMDKRLPHSLSGGEQQRVALARALASNPAVILLDEPFSNLDAQLRGRTRWEVKHVLKDAGVSAIFVTHDQDEALSLADRVGVMLNGQIVQAGTPEEVYGFPASLEVAKFLGEVNLINGLAENGVVHTELGLLQTPSRLKGSVTVVVRPEAVTLHPVEQGKPTDQDGVLTRMVDREFYGHAQLVRLRLPSGQLLFVRCGPVQNFEFEEAVIARVSTPVPAFAAIA